MELFFSTLLEIAKFTIPALVIYYTIQKVTKNQLNSIVGLKNLEFRQQQMDQILPIKLQAYERMTLLLSRTRLGNLLGRMNTQEVSIEQLKTLIIVAVKQEIDHNTSQKIYVSEKLWEVVNVSIEKSLHMMDEVSKLPQINTTQDFVQALYAADKIDGEQISNIAHRAVREEVNSIL